MWLVFILTNKVGSPQYVLWVAPLAPLLPLRTWGGWVWAALLLVVFGASVPLSKARPTATITLITAITCGMSLRSRPTCSRCPSPTAEYSSSAAISDRHENAHPSFSPCAIDGSIPGSVT